jgi:hypothetical protein
MARRIFPIRNTTKDEKARIYFSFRETIIGYCAILINDEPAIEGKWILILILWWYIV